MERCDQNARATTRGVIRMRANGLIHVIRAASYVACTAIEICGLLCIPDTVKADVLEQGITYNCSKTEVSVESFTKDGGGQEEPFLVFESEKNATWNIDRLTRKLPIVKTCAIGIHEISVVISEHCAADDGVAVSVAIFSDTKIVVSGKDKIDASNPPLAQAVTFGFSCSHTTEAFFTKIVVRTRQPGAKELSVQMN